MRILVIAAFMAIFGLVACDWDDGECPDRCTTVLDRHGEVLECHCAPEDIVMYCEEREEIEPVDPDYDPDKEM